jgi:hypothetical protein
MESVHEGGGVHTASGLSYEEIAMFRTTVVRQIAIGLATVAALTAVFLPAGWTFLQQAQQTKTEQTSPAVVLQSNGNAAVKTGAGIFQPEDGSISGNVYTNNFFEFTFEFPRGWLVQTDGTKISIEESGTATANMGDLGGRGDLDSLTGGSHLLLHLLQHPIGTSSRVNPGLLIVAKDVSCSSGAETGEKILLALKAELARRNSRFDFAVMHEPTNVILGGRVFSRMDASMDSPNGISLYQGYVSTVLNGYALIFVLDSGKPERLDDLFQTLNTLQFKAQLAAPTQDFPNKPQSWEILTPTMGVDFRPYVNRFLTVVQRNWHAVMPEEALKGAKGLVVLRFHIQQDGEIPPNEPWIEKTSGSDPLDKAAAAAIRNSSPFEQLPASYQNPSIELRFPFFYNLPIPCR